MMYEPKTSKLMILEWAILAGIPIACFMFLYNQISSLDAKMERRWDRMQEQIQIQSERSDRLYEMFYEVVKEKRNDR